MSPRLLNTLILASFFGALLISNLFYFWVKLGGNILKITGAAQLILIIVGVVSFMILMIKMINNPAFRARQNFYPLIVCIITLSVFSIFKIHATEESFQSNVKLRACKQAELYTARFFLREDQTFEDIRTGPAGSLNYANGNWKMSGDTVKLDYSTGNNKVIGDLFLVRENNLFSIRSGELLSTGYSVGYCRN
jgi:hypothetical protein